MKIVILGKEHDLEFRDRKFPVVADLAECPRCDAPGPVQVYLKHGDYYGVCCGYHVGGPK